MLSNVLDITGSIIIETSKFVDEIDNITNKKISRKRKYNRYSNEQEDDDENEECKHENICDMFNQSNLQPLSQKQKHKVPINKKKNTEITKKIKDNYEIKKRKTKSKSS